MIRIYAIGIALVLAVGYFLYTQTRIESLSSQLAEKSLAVEERDREIALMREQHTRQVSELNGLSQRLSQAEDRSRKATAMLRKHDLEKLIKERPSLLENKLNEATKRVFRQIEADTAAP